MKRSTVLALVCLAVFVVGTALLLANAPPAPLWRIETVDPRGRKHEVYYMREAGRPSLRVSWSGHTGVSGLPGVAVPQGWRIVITREGEIR